MAFKVSGDKMAVNIKIPEKNYGFLDAMVKEKGGSIAGYINEALYEWLKIKGLEAEEFVDGRKGKWIVKREKA